MILNALCYVIFFYESDVTWGKLTVCCGSMLLIKLKGKRKEVVPLPAWLSDLNESLHRTMSGAQLRPNLKLFMLISLKRRASRATRQHMHNRSDYLALFARQKADATSLAVRSPVERGALKATRALIHGPSQFVQVNGIDIR